jgi:hypothetical protein
MQARPAGGQGGSVAVARPQVLRVAGALYAGRDGLPHA